MRQLCEILFSPYLYDKDVTIIKRLDNTYRVINLNAVRISGLETRKFSKKNTVNESKLDCNISRAKSKVREYVLCNSWDYFCTLTISPEKFDRYNLKNYIKELGIFIQNYNRLCSDEQKVRYLFVPEMHADGAWHLHGFIKGIRDCDIYINQNGYISWKQYDEKFGYLSFSRIRSKEKCSNYILKYITKDIARSVSTLGNHLYYCSKGLKTAETVFRGNAEIKCPWDFEGEYCRVLEVAACDLERKVVLK